MFQLPTKIQIFVMNLVSFCVLADEEIGEYSRLRGWRDVGEGDIKIFLAHLIAMGLVRKGCLEKYWDHEESQDAVFWNVHGEKHFSGHPF